MTGNLSGTQNQPLSLAGNFLLAISKAPGYTYLYGMAYECFTGAPAFAGTSMPDLCAHDRIPMTCFKQTHVRMDDNATCRTQAGHAVEAGGARSGSPRYRGNPAHTDYQSAVLQTLVSGRRNGVAQGMIAARMDELDPEAIPVMPQASMPGPAPVAERPVVAPAMTVTNAKEKELLGCCMNGNAGKARILLKYKYVNVNATCNHCTLLLSFRTVNINIRQYDGATPLFAAVQSNSTGIVKLLISNGADVNIPLTNGTTPLCRAAAQDNVEIVDRLLQVPGIRVNQTDDEGATALYFACQVGQVGSARLLLDKKADPNIVDIDGVAPLHLTCLHGFTEIVEMLLEAVNTVADLDGLCSIYNRMATIERKKLRSTRKHAPRPVPGAGDDAALPGACPPVFSLGDKQRLDADAVEDAIRQHLAQTYHRFISQAVNDMEFGRGKPTPGYPGVLHVSAGISGVGSCSVFFSPGDEANPVRIAGIGHHLDRRTYRLTYAAAGLQGLRTMRLS